MLKGSDVIGKSVVAFDSGKRLCQVQDLIFDQDQNRLIALLVEEKGFLRSAKVLPIEALKSIGVNAVITQSKQDIISAHSQEKIAAILECDNTMKGTQILTVMGQNLGKMVDLYFDETTGLIEGYEVSGGIFADAYSGRSFVPATQTLRIGEDYAFVPTSVADLMEEQVGGIKAVLQSTGEKAQDVVQKAGEQLSELPHKAEEGLKVASDLTQDMAQKAGTAIQGIAQKTSQATVQYAVEQTLGRRVATTVQARNGVIVAAPGQVVTEAVIDRARTMNMETALLQSVGLSSVDAAKSSTQDAISRAQDQFTTAKHTVGTQVQSNASHLLSWARETTDELRYRSTKSLEDQRIKGALGRPVTRVILDRADRLILNSGDLITHRSIMEARQADVLDVLLGSVYTKSPQFSPSSLRAPEAGQASLPVIHSKERLLEASVTSSNGDYG